MRSALLRLNCGEVGEVGSSRGERRLLKFAVGTFGEPLGSFLLSGLGEETVALKWRFTVTYRDDRGTLFRRKVIVEADDLTPDIITFLPRQHEPLAILALLYIMTQNQETWAAKLQYKRREVTRLLGWGNSPEAKAAVDEAVDRYSYLSYKWAASKEELLAEGRSFGHGLSRFVLGCGYRDIDAGEGRRSRRTMNRIDFSPAFVSELLNRSLFGIRWNGVTSIKRFTYKTRRPRLLATSDGTR
jgi:hypothetical protein